MSIDSNGTSKKYYKFYNIEIKIIFQCKSTKNKSEIRLDAIYIYYTEIIKNKNIEC